MYTAIASLLGSAGLVAAVGWVFNLGNRMTKVETHVEDLPLLIEKQFDAVCQRLDRIERAMNGALRGHE